MDAEFLLKWISLPWYIQLLQIGIPVLGMSTLVFAIGKIVTSVSKKTNIEYNKEKGILKILRNKDKDISPDSKIIEDKKLPPISQHQIFLTLKDAIERNLCIDSDLESSCSDEKLMIHEVFIRECKCQVFYDELKKFIDEIQISRDPNNFLYSITDKIYEWIQEYNDKARGIKIIFNSGKIIYGVPEIYIRKFDQWHDAHIGAVLQKIRGVLHSDFYKSWKLRLFVILEHLDMAFILTFQDAEKTLGELNGELDRAITERINSMNNNLPQGHN